MRRAALIAALALAIYAAPAGAADTEVTVSGFAFAPATVDIAPGETVTWRFSGPDTNHSATSDPGQADSWDSDPGNTSPNHTIGDTFKHTFMTAGTFTYLCKVHPYSMRARVVVSAPGGPPPGGGGGGSPPPSGGGGGGPPPPVGDTTAPRLTTLRANAKRRRATFKLDEAATVAVKLRGPTRRDSNLDGKRGTNVVKLPSRLKAGRYRLTLTATDAAGNEAASASIKFSVKK